MTTTNNKLEQKIKADFISYFGNEPKEISRIFKQRLEKEVRDFNEINTYRSRFKFLELIGEPLSRLKLLAEKEHPYFFNALDDYEDDLFDDKMKQTLNVRPNWDIWKHHILDGDNIATIQEAPKGFC